MHDLKLKRGWAAHLARYLSHFVQGVPVPHIAWYPGYLDTRSTPQHAANPPVPSLHEGTSEIPE